MTATGYDDLLRGESDLLAVFEQSFRPAKRAVGIESERVALFDGGAPLHYHSDPTAPGVDAVFAQLIERRGWTPVAPETVGGPVLGLERAKANITLEPGSQFELSGAPHDSLHGLHQELSDHRAEMRSLDLTPKLHLLGLGFQPYARQDDLDWVPKSRYPIMREYLPTRGPRALDMMRRTATVQANFDFGTERDAMRKLRASLGISAAVSGLFANSPLKDGVRQAVKSERALVWLGMDPDRSGLLPFAWKTDATLADYAHWALDAPMFLVKRDGVAMPAMTHTFRRFMAEGFHGHRATQSDWETHLKTMFPEVRLARTLEVRGADSVPLRYATALAALWTAVLYDDAALTAVEETFVPYGHDAWQALRPRIAAEGLRTPIGQTTVGALLRRVLPVAVEALGRRALLNADGQDERQYLDPLLPLVADDRSVTDALLDGWTPEQPDALASLMARCEF
jgi:glutamate--cysteine ligase